MLGLLSRIRCCARWDSWELGRTMLAVTYLSGLLVLQDRSCRIVHKITEESSQIPRVFFLLQWNIEGIGAVSCPSLQWIRQDRSCDEAEDSCRSSGILKDYRYAVRNFPETRSIQFRLRRILRDPEGSSGILRDSLGLEWAALPLLAG